MKMFYKVLAFVVISSWILVNVYIFMTVDNSSHSISDTFFGFAPLFIQNTVPVMAVLWVTNLLITDGDKKKSKKTKKSSKNK